MNQKFYKHINELLKDSKLSPMAGDTKKIQQINKLLKRLLPSTLQNQCTASLYKNGIVTLLCHTASAASRIRFMTELLDEIKKIDGLEAAFSIQCKVSKQRPKAPTQTHPTRLARPLSPRTKAGLNRLADSLTDEALAESLRKLSTEIA